MSLAAFGGDHLIRHKTISIGIRKRCSHAPLLSNLARQFELFAYIALYIIYTRVSWADKQYSQGLDSSGLERRLVVPVNSLRKGINIAFTLQL